MIILYVCLSHVPGVQRGRNAEWEINRENGQEKKNYSTKCY